MKELLPTSTLDILKIESSLKNVIQKKLGVLHYFNAKKPKLTTLHFSLQKTHAYHHLKDTVPESVKKRRTQEVIDCARQGMLGLNQSQIGQEQLILIEGVKSCLIYKSFIVEASQNIILNKGLKVIILILLNMMPFHILFKKKTTYMY